MFGVISVTPIESTIVFMIANGKSLIDLIDSILTKEGFVKKKDTWYRSTDECICFFSLGKSTYGGYYEHVMGGFIKELNTTGKTYPLYYKAHLKYSLQMMADKELVQRTFDLENTEFSVHQREDIIQELLELYAIPFLNDISTKEGIKQAVHKYEDLVYWLNGDTREHLSIELPEKG